MDIHPLDRDHLVPENGARTQRLLPWPELNAPFEGSWAVVEAGTASGLHAHHEHEIFVAVRGTAVLECGGRRSPFAAGDIVRLPVLTEHRVVNDGDADFEMYCIWWDAEMAERFTARLDHEAKR